MILELIATLCAGLFAGAAIYVSLVEHPARLQCGLALAVAEFGPSYRRAAVMQAALAVVGCLAAVAAWAPGSAAVVLVAFTLIVIRPTNKRLLDPTLEPGSAGAAMLLARRGRRHALRGLASGVAFLLLGLHRPGIV
jgi:Domain of unknown function (DUF1772)